MQGAACRRKDGKRKNGEMQAPAALIPSTLCAYHSVYYHVKPAKHTQGHTASLLPPVPGPGIYEPLPFL